MSTIIEKIEEARQFLVSQACDAPEFGLILGSGLGELAEEIENAVVIPYEKIPNWGKSTVAGHAGQLVYGDLGGHKVLALQDVSILRRKSNGIGDFPSARDESSWL